MSVSSSETLENGGLRKARAEILATVKTGDNRRVDVVRKE